MKPIARRGIGWWLHPTLLRKKAPHVGMTRHLAVLMQRLFLKVTLGAQATPCFLALQRGNPLH